MKLWQIFTGLFFVFCAVMASWSFLSPNDPRIFVPVAFGFMLFTLTAKHYLSLIEEIADKLDAMTSGDFSTGQLPQTSTFAETARLIQSANQLSLQLNEAVERANDLSKGDVDVVRVEGAVLRSGNISHADLKIRKNAGELEKSLTALTNQLRRLAIQARIIARDDLQNPLLDAPVSGEVGEAFTQMVENLRVLNSRAERIADGDLTTHSATSGGQLNESFNVMTDRLIDLVNQIQHTGLHISTSTEEMSLVLQEQELAASHQASSVEETQRTMETLLSSAKKIAESAQTVFKSAERTQANNRTVADRIGELKSHTERIAEILDVIKSIADRSDLLALNASLEGMRAGEAGKGFTLVAAEMRRLAENIKGSVGDINELLVDIRVSSLSSVMATEEGSNLSERTTDSALKITLITQQQQSGTEQVTQSMEELSLLINQGVSGTNQLGAAASELVALAEGLRKLVEGFRTGRALSPASTSREISVVRTSTAEQGPKKTKVASRASRESQMTPVGLAEQGARPTTRLTRQNDEQPTIEFSALSEDSDLDLGDLERAAREASEASDAKSVVEQLDDIDAAIDAREDDT